MLLGLLVTTCALGLAGFSPARLLFVIGCAGVGYQAYRVGRLPLHAPVVVVLFVFAPFLRRIVDVHVGYDASGIMLVGPLASMVGAFPALRGLLTQRCRSEMMLIPYVLMFGCVLYAWGVSSFAGTLTPSLIVAAKYVIPLLYCLCLMLCPDDSEAVLQGVARCFVVAGPVVGLYGIWQYLSPQAWDRYWMIQSKILSIGLPLPNQVRVFSTMNSPVSFAAYGTTGLLLLGFRPLRSPSSLAIIPVVLLPLCLAILLTSVRAAWLGAGASLAFTLLFGRTRYKATALLVVLALVVAFALLFTSFGDVIGGRLSTLTSSVNGDGSGHERLGDYLHVFGGDDRYIAGTGLVPVDGDGQLAALDGQVLTSAAQMGTTIGLLFVFCIIWAGLQAALGIVRAATPLRIAAGAVVIGNLLIMPLTAIAIGEVGVLFWLLVGALSGRAFIPVPRPRPTMRAA